VIHFGHRFKRQGTRAAVGVPGILTGTLCTASMSKKHSSLYLVGRGLTPHSSADQIHGPCRTTRAMAARPYVSVSVHTFLCCSASAAESDTPLGLEGD
jgi:hypothetical protein